MSVVNTRVVIMVFAFTCYQVLHEVEGLNHGENAELGQFPYVMRIVVSEDNVSPGKKENVKDAGRVATGTLITDLRVLTTCDSVGFFTGQTVNLHNVSRVSIMGGSVKKTGEGGQFRYPVKSSVHPFCYSMVTGIVLFNYGLYELGASFTHNNYLRPLHLTFKTGRDQEMVLRKMTHRGLKVECESAGWGYPRNEFEGQGMPDRFEASSRILQTTEMTVVSYDECYEKTCIHFGDCLISIWEYGFACAKAPKGGPCMNDKGAPLVCKGQLFAIHSNPQKCHDEGIPRLFMRVDLAFDYIYDKTNGTDSRPINSYNVLLVMLIYFFSHS